MLITPHEFKTTLWCIRHLTFRNSGWRHININRRLVNSLMRNILWFFLLIILMIFMLLFLLMFKEALLQYLPIFQLFLLFLTRYFVILLLSWIWSLFHTVAHPIFLLNYELNFVIISINLNTINHFGYLSFITYSTYSIGLMCM